MSSFSDYSEALLNNIFYRGQSHTGPANVYLALFTASPTDAGGGTECSYSGYARQATAFDAPSSGVTQNTSTEVWAAVAGSSNTIVAVGVFDASSGGNLLCWKALGTSITYSVGDVPQIAAGGFTITVGGSASDFKRDKAINVLFRNTAYTGAAAVYVELYSVAPTGAGGGTPFAYTGYTRESAVFTAPSGGVSDNTGIVEYDPVVTAPVTLVAVATFDASTSGNMLDFVELDTSIEYAINDIPRFAVGGIDVSVD